jgi:hypothetical protein
MENYHTEANRNSDKKIKMELDWIGNTLRKEAGAIDKNRIRLESSGVQKKQAEENVVKDNRG